MDKNRIACRGKCGGCAGEHRALTWADLPGAIRAEISRHHSSRRNEPGLEDARSNCETGGLTRRRAEPNGDVLTAGRTVVTDPAAAGPVGEVTPSAAMMGSRWALGSAFRPAPHVGSPRV
jgi:hypothetical protein